MGLLTAVASVGAVLTGLVAGSVVDRWNRRRLMIWCDVSRIVLYALVPLWWLAGPQIWLLYVVVALGSAFDMMFQVAYVTAVTGLVPTDQLTRANGRLQGSNAMAYVVGPGLAGVLVGVVGSTATIGADALTFVASAVGLMVIRFRVVEKPDGVEAAGSVSVRLGFMQGLRFLWRSPLLRMLTILLTLITFLSLGLTDVFIYDVRHGLHQGNQAVGVVLGLASTGSIVAAVLAAPLRRIAGFGGCWLGSFALCGVAIVFAGLTTNLATLAVMATLFSFGSTLAGVCSMTLRQEITPDHLLGRVTSAFWTLNSALGPIGAAVVTLAVARLGTRPPLVAVGVAFLVIVVAGTFSPIRVREPHAAPEVLPSPP
jgi:MFS family permease